MTILEATASAAGKALLNKLVDRTIEALGITGSERDRVLEAVKSTDEMSIRAREVRLVKTIVHQAGPVDLHEFYHPMAVVVPGSDSRIVPDHLRDLPHAKLVVLEAPVGTGKSMLLRHLASSEFTAGESLPLFIELRALGRGAMAEGARFLINHVRLALESFGLPTTNAAVDIALRSGDVVLLLDGFDELDYARQDTLALEIAQLSSKFPKLRIYVTTRPETPITYTKLATRLEVCSLRKNEWADVLSGYEADDERRDRIIHEVRGTNVEAILTTPLMVALLVVRFDLGASLPRNVVEFYKGLFPLLADRHDAVSSDGNTRKRRSGLSTESMETAFGALSYGACLRGELSMSRRSAERHAQNCLRLANAPDVAPDDFLRDIVHITSLLLYDEDNYEFIHKSVPEYEAAAFLLDREDRLLAEIAKQLISIDGNTPITGVFFFVERISPRKFQRFVLIPFLASILNPHSTVGANLFPSIKPTQMKDILALRSLRSIRRRLEILRLVPKYHDLWTLTNSLCSLAAHIDTIQRLGDEGSQTRRFLDRLVDWQGTVRSALVGERRAAEALWTDDERELVKPLEEKVMALEQLAFLESEADRQCALFVLRSHRSVDSRAVHPGTFWSDSDVHKPDAPANRTLTECAAELQLAISTGNQDAEERAQGLIGALLGHIERLRPPPRLDDLVFLEPADRQHAWLAMDCHRVHNSRVVQKPGRDFWTELGFGWRSEHTDQIPTRLAAALHEAIAGGNPEARARARELIESLRDHLRQLRPPPRKEDLAFIEPSDRDNAWLAIECHYIYHTDVVQRDGRDFWFELNLGWRTEKTERVPRQLAAALFEAVATDGSDAKTLAKQLLSAVNGVLIALKPITREEVDFLDEEADRELAYAVINCYGWAGTKALPQKNRDFWKEVDVDEFDTDAARALNNVATELGRVVTTGDRIAKIRAKKLLPELARHINRLKSRSH